MQSQRTSESAELHLAGISRGYANEAMSAWQEIADRSACDPALANVLEAAVGTLRGLVGPPAAHLELVR